MKIFNLHISVAGLDTLLCHFGRHNWIHIKRFRGADGKRKNQCCDFCSAERLKEVHA